MKWSRPLGHPVHPAVVPFPIAFWTVTTVAGVVQLFWIDDLIAKINLWSNAAALSTAAVAMTSGFIEYVSLKEESIRTANYHLMLVTLCASLYGVALILRSQSVLQISVVLECVAWIVLMVGGWFGGRLVFHYGAGVDVQKPQKTKE